MYHLYKQFFYGDQLTRKLLSYKEEPNAATIPYTSVITLSPHFFRDELTTGIDVVHAEGAAWRGAGQAFDLLVFYPLMELLEVYFRENAEGAKTAAEEMIGVLDGLFCSDDHSFPESQIEALRKMIEAH